MHAAINLHFTSMAATGRGKKLIKIRSREVYRLLVVAVANVLLDPVQVVGDIGVHRWEAFDAARLHAEAHDAGQHPLELFIVVEHEWRTGVTLRRASRGEKIFEIDTITAQLRLFCDVPEHESLAF